jgi:hypothetical protein
VSHNREFEDGILSSDLLVHGGKGVQFVFNVLLVLGVQVDFEDRRSVNPVADALANNLGGVDEVIKDGLVDGSDSARSGAVLLGLPAARGGLADDSPLDNQHNGLANEFLLQLADEAGLDAAELDALVVGDEEDDGLLVTLELNLASRGDLEVPQLVLELSRPSLEVEECLGDLGLELRDLFSLLLLELFASGEHCAS